MSICDSCDGKCCTQFKVELYCPAMTPAQFKDHLNWIGRHKNVYVEKVDAVKRWALVQFNEPCESLGDDGRCTDYEGRPHTCRLYKCDKLRKA